MALLAFAAMGAMAADVDGTWTASVQGPNNQTFDMKFNLKADGDKLTGTMSAPQGGDVAIEDGKVDGNKVSFKVKRQMGDNTFVLNYKGTVSGDEMKLTSSREGSDRPPREMTAKRAK
jgi:hypothetical protein